MAEADAAMIAPLMIERRENERRTSWRRTLLVEAPDGAIRALGMSAMASGLIMTAHLMDIELMD
jgi:hypothetical protein